MMRFLALAVLLPVLAAAGPPARTGSGQVSAVRLEPGSGHTELTIEVQGGEVEWDDFKLLSPARVVVDVRGARSGLSR
ncbi:MAG: AMIN domain-containing protein, partial [Gemmatimonadota bacterium]|nr:AMIN domain-containing protein [Gemmatimonadota bacterium]